MHTPDGFVPSQTLPTSLPEEGLVFAFRSGRIAIIGTPDAPVIPRADQLFAAGLMQATGLASPLHYLGEMEGIACAALGVDDSVSDEVAAAAGLQFVGLRSLFPRLPRPLLAIAGRASQVVEWDRTHRYCGRCGGPMHDRSNERAKECPACGFVAYPRVSPAMMVLVTRGDELLLARAHHFVPGMYSALAGFVESGETIEDCIQREVREEVGIEVKNLKYFASQSWPFPHALMIAFNAEWAAGDIVLGVEEMDDARWFSVDALPDLPSPVSIARRLIDTTIERIRRQ